MTQLDSELLKKAVQVAVFYNNYSCELEEIVEMFCMDAAQAQAAAPRFPHIPRVLVRGAALELHITGVYDNVIYVDLPAQAAVEPVALSSDFIKRTNEEYAAWCKSFYQADSLDERGMKSLDGLWAWQAVRQSEEAAVEPVSDAHECDRAIMLARTSVMNKQREAMLLALEALKKIRPQRYPDTDVDAAIAALEKELNRG